MKPLAPVSLFLLLVLRVEAGSAPDAPTFDIIIRHGAILDGSGGPRYDGDIGIANGYILAIGDLGASKAAVEIDARGLYVAPGFINIHSHSNSLGLTTAVNMLTQGVTTEIINADGAGPLDIGRQLAGYLDQKLAVNVGVYIGLNSIWREVAGNADRRPTKDEIEKMRALIAAGLSQGAWGVSAGLDYQPAYFARTDEVIAVVEAARRWRTNFTNHDRVTPESNFSSRAGIAETIHIGEKAGVMPVVTHMKVQGHEQGSAGDVLSSLMSPGKSSAYVAADAYPYLAGLSGLGLILPGWAQDGGRTEMLKRFADPATRKRIAEEAERAMALRFGGPKGVYLLAQRRELTDIMREMNAGAGETVVRLAEKGDNTVILRFGDEADLVKILQHPTTSMACDCGAVLGTNVHPRFFGSFPRVLGRYVREQRIMSWEEAIRKSSALPAATIGMADRGMIAVGMAGDVTVFDPRTVIDRATYEEPALVSEGIRYVVVNGRVALADGRATGVAAGRPLSRAANMPSRPMTGAGAHRVRARGSFAGRSFQIDVRQAAAAVVAKGRFAIRDAASKPPVTIEAFGRLQTAPGWASFTGRARSGGKQHAVLAIVDSADPSLPGETTLVVRLDDAAPWTGKLRSDRVSIQ